MIKEFEFDGRVWTHKYSVMDIDGNECFEKRTVSIVDVPVSCLLVEYEDMVVELFDKETELLKVKEEYTAKEFDIVFKSDINFKELYGSTSEKVRKQHAKEVLSDLSNRKVGLELSVEYLKSYIPLLKETIRIKHDSIPHINSPTPIVLDGGHINRDKLEKQIRKALDDVKP